MKYASSAVSAFDRAPTILRTATGVTVIMSNGSKWGGESPDLIETLLERLRDYALDRVFEEYGNFVSRPVRWHEENAISRTVPDATGFFGNFRELSHVFTIYSNDPTVIERLVGAIRANQLRPDYLAQPDPIERAQAKRRVEILDERRRRPFEVNGEWFATSEVFSRLPESHKATNPDRILTGDLEVRPVTVIGNHDKRVTAPNATCAGGRPTFHDVPCGERACACAQREPA